MVRRPAPMIEVKSRTSREARRVPFSLRFPSSSTRKSSRKGTVRVAQTDNPADQGSSGIASSGDLREGVDGGHGTRSNTEARSHGDERWSGVGSRPDRAGWGRRVNRADASHERRRRGLRLPDSLASPRALRARPTPRHRASHGGNQLVLSVRPRDLRGSVLFFVNRREALFRLQANGCGCPPNQCR